MKDGLDSGERARHIVDPARRVEHPAHLRAFGIDVDAVQSSGQFVLLDWSQLYLSEGRFDQARVMSDLATDRAEGRRRGFSRTQYAADMEWALGIGSFSQLIEYQATSNLALLSGNVVICAYQLGRWGGDLVVNALRTHPLVIMGGLLHANPFYRQPGGVLAGLKGQRPTTTCC